MSAYAAADEAKLRKITQKCELFAATQGDISRAVFPWTDVALLLRVIERQGHASPSALSAFADETALDIARRIITKAALPQDPQTLAKVQTAILADIVFFQGTAAAAEARKAARGAREALQELLTCAVLLDGEGCLPARHEAAKRQAQRALAALPVTEDGDG
jgi:hypothetical protein